MGGTGQRDMIEPRDEAVSVFASFVCVGGGGGGGACVCGARCRAAVLLKVRDEEEEREVETVKSRGTRGEGEGKQGVAESQQARRAKLRAARRAVEHLCARCIVAVCGMPFSTSIRTPKTQRLSVVARLICV